MDMLISSNIIDVNAGSAREVARQGTPRGRVRRARRGCDISRVPAAIPPNLVDVLICRDIVDDRATAKEEAREGAPRGSVRRAHRGCDLNRVPAATSLV
jgi:hypothetical protein